MNISLKKIYKPTSLIITEMHMKTTGWLLSKQSQKSKITSMGEDMKKLELLCTAHENVKQ